MNDFLPADFTARMRALLAPDDYNDYLAALGEPPRRMARKNPAKPIGDAYIRAELGGYPLVPEGVSPGKLPLHHAGAYYVQEPAARAVAELLAPLLPPAPVVLDMCAAPGGKVTAVAAACPDGYFFANEIVFSRAKILLSNVERLGLRNVSVGSLAPDKLARLLPERCDAVIADVPCSGEGMLRKTTLTESDLSDESVAACVARARKILLDCDACLCTGGILLFSTCTFNRAENEEQVRFLCRELGYEPIEPAVRPPASRPGFDLPAAVRFFPQDGGGEGHFACLLRKTRGNKRTQIDGAPGKLTRGDSIRRAAALEAAKEITREKLDPARLSAVGGGWDYTPEGYPFLGVPVLRRGMRVADFIGDRAVVHHHFVTAARADLLIDAPDYAPDAKEIAAYLAGGEFACDAPRGYRALTVAGLPLGLIKVTGGIAKNHYPKGLRN